MTAWTGDVKGMAGEGRTANKGVLFQAPVKEDLYNRYVLKTAQAEGLICHVWIPKDVTVAASDTLTLTVKAA